MTNKFKTVCNHYLRRFDRAAHAVRQTLQDRSTNRYTYTRAKIFLRQFPVYRSIVVAARELEPGRNLKLNADSDAARILTDHELAFRISPSPIVFTPWFFKDGFLVVHSCHIRKVIDTVVSLFQSSYRSVIPFKPKNDNPDIPF